MRVSEGIGTLEGGDHPRDGRIGVAEQPQSPRHQGQVGHSGILAGRPRRQSLLLAAGVECIDGPLDRFAGGGQMSHEKENHRLPAHRVEQRRSITARLGEIKQDRDRLLGPRQLPAHDARSGQPEHDLKMLGRVSEALAQLARTGEGRHRLVRGRPLGGDQAGTQRELEIELQPVLCRALGQMAQGLDAALRVRDGLEIGGAHGGLSAGLQPIPHRLFEQSGFREMVRERLRLRLDDLRVPLLERVGDRGMQLCASALQESGVGGVSHKRVLEGIDRVGYLAPAEYQLRPNQLGKRLLQRLPRQPGYRVQQLVGELATHHGADLSHLPHRRQSVEPRHQRCMQCRRNRHRGQRTIEHVVVVALLQQPGFEHGLGQLLDEQRHAIGTGEDLLHHLLGERFAGRDALDQRRPVASAQARERESSSRAHDLARAA